jgi:hypothetical protein
MALQSFDLARTNGFKLRSQSTSSTSSSSGCSSSSFKEAVRVEGDLDEAQLVELVRSSFARVRSFGVRLAMARAPTPN